MVYKYGAIVQLCVSSNTKITTFAKTLIAYRHAKEVGRADTPVKEGHHTSQAHQTKTVPLLSLAARRGSVHACCVHLFGLLQQFATIPDHEARRIELHSENHSIFVWRVHKFSHPLPVQAI